MAKTAVVAAILGGVLTCQRATEQQARAEEPDTLKAGVAVPAMLMQELESGVCKEDDPVSLIVTDDVKAASGRVVVKAGTPLKGVVAWSRGANAIGALTNQPARLHLRLTETTAIDGTAVPLACDPTLKPDATCELNRGNTGRIDLMPKLEQLLQDPQNQQAAQALTDLLRDGRLDDAAKTPEGMEKLGNLCDTMGLKKTAVMLREHQADKAQDIVKQIQAGIMLSSAATGGGTGGIGTVLELAGAVGEVGSHFGQALKGRNIKAYVGTPVTAYVARDVSIKR